MGPNPQQGNAPDRVPPPVVNAVPARGGNAPDLTNMTFPSVPKGNLSSGSVDPSDRAKFFTNLDSKFDLNEWIKMSGLTEPRNPTEAAIFNEDLNKIRKLGIWKESGGDGEKAPLMVRAVPLKALRGIMGASWVCTVAAMATSAAAAPVALIVYTPLLLVANWGIQRLCGWLYNQKFESVMSKLRSETERPGSIQAGIAWVGVMHEFLEKQNPLFLLPNQTKLWNFHSSTSVEGIKAQLRQAAQTAADKLEETITSDAAAYFKNHFFKAMLSQNAESLNGFEKRCMSFPNGSAPYANPLWVLKKLW